MKKILLGDTINFQTIVLDVDEIPITDAIVNLDVIDSSGSTVLSAVIPHIDVGIYNDTKPTDGWSDGPVQQNWTVKTSTGTISNSLWNQFRITTPGTTIDTYVFEHELEGWFPNILDYLDNNSEDHVIAAYKYENRLIEGLGYNTPINKNVDGFYDQSLRDFNALNAIYRIIDADQSNQVAADEEGAVWYDRFLKRANMVYKDWESKKITFRHKTSPGESGILPVSRTAGSSVGFMVNNHDEKYGSGFRGADYRRTWQIEVTGTGLTGGVRECEFKWTNDGGLGTATGTTSDSWIHLSEQAYIRFSMGTGTALNDIFKIGDKWEFITNPVKNQVGAKNTAKGY